MTAKKFQIAVASMPDDKYLVQIFVEIAVSALYRYRQNRGGFIYDLGQVRQAKRDVTAIWHVGLHEGWRTIEVNGTKGEQKAVAKALAKFTARIHVHQD